MPPRRGRYAPHLVTYDHDDVPKDETMASMAAKIDM